MMTDLLAYLYPWTKSLHIMSVIAWMAGLFYLPRLFVYHAEQSVPGDSRDEVFQQMEFKLLKVIMTPAMVSTWIFGLLLLVTPGIVDWGSVWPYVKLVGVITLTWLHFWMATRRKEFQSGSNRHSGRYFRMMNEVPTVAMIFIVFAVVIKF